MFKSTWLVVLLAVLALLSHSSEAHHSPSDISADEPHVETTTTPILQKRAKNLLKKRQAPAAPAAAAPAAPAAAAAPAARAPARPRVQAAADTEPPAPKGISPIQIRPAILDLSMPFALTCLSLTLILFALMLRGSAAIGTQARDIAQRRGPK